MEFNGQTEAAFNHYKEVFGAEFKVPFVRAKSMNPELDGTPEGERIVHVALNLGTQTLIGNDSPSASTDFVQNPQAYSLFVEVETKEEGHRLFDALALGGNVKIPLEEQPWGDYFGHLVDKFGIKWDVKVV